MHDAPSTMPAVTPASAGYWSELRRGVFALPNCEACGHRWFPPSARCPACLSDRIGVAPASGRGRLWSWTVMRRQYFKDFAPPYVVALIRLAEGPLVTSSIVHAQADALRCDLPVRAVVERFRDGQALLRFEPDPSEPDR